MLCVQAEDGYVAVAAAAGVADAVAAFPEDAAWRLAWPCLLN